MESSSTSRTNPSPDAFDVVIHLNGSTYSTQMPVTGQQALVDFVNDGGGYLGFEWSAYEVENNRMLAMQDLVLLDLQFTTQ